MMTDAEQLNTSNLLSFAFGLQFHPNVETLLDTVGLKTTGLLVSLFAKRTMNLFIQKEQICWTTVKVLYTLDSVLSPLLNCAPFKKN
jgi:hypothetical protein